MGPAEAPSTPIGIHNSTGILSGPASRPVEQGAALYDFRVSTFMDCMIWHRIAPLAAIWKVGLFVS
jgi:hypothetical protein